jgi:hypothetical protein
MSLAPRAVSRALSVAGQFQSGMLGSSAFAVARRRSTLLRSLSDDSKCSTHCAARLRRRSAINCPNGSTGQDQHIGTLARCGPCPTVFYLIVQSRVGDDHHVFGFPVPRHRSVLQRAIWISCW